jgi:type IV pilus assembly protein PilX
MNKFRSKPHMSNNPKRQGGFALLVALIFLIALTVLGVSVLRSSTLNERVVGNDLDRQRAYQAAEAAIRDAQKDILQISATGSLCVGLPGCRDSIRYGSRDSGETDLTGGCSEGICFFPTTDYAAPGFVSPWNLTGPLNAPAKYGAYSGASFAELNSALGIGLSLSREPEYWIEILEKPATETGYRYRITARGYGVNPATVVSLQEIYDPGL